MMPREVAPTHFPNLAVTLFADRTVIAFTPATSDLPWAASATWAAARAVARAGRRVGLVDLNLEQPALQQRAADAAEEGIVDAFVFGASLGHVAREQEPDLHFIPVGTAPTNPDDVWTSDRWQRLARGFRQEGALLLLFVPPAALPRLNVELDGLVVLAPTGYAPESLTFPGIGDRLKRGTTLVAVVCNERSAPRPTPAPAPRPSRPSLRLRQPKHRTLARPAVLVSVAAAGVGLAVMLLLVGGSGDAPEAVVVAEPSPAPRPAPPPPPVRDSLFYSVQVAAFNQPDQAAAYARDMGGDEAATVSPVRLGRQGVWFRVMVGVLPTAAAADSLLRALWRRGTVERPSGTILRTPHAFVLGRGDTPEAAGAVREGLRQRGIAAYIVPAPDGSAQVLAGAFETPDQARAADSLLRLAGLRATLVQRMGTRR